MLSEQLSDEQIKDGLALARFKEDDPDAWAALGRLILRMNADVIDRWTRDPTLKRAYVQGARESLGAILPAIMQSVEDARQVMVEDEHARVAVKSHADDGVGSGDLAI